MRLFFCCFIFLSLLSSCSSPIKKANKLLEAGQFQEAVALLERASTEKPNDLEIVSKLNEAKTKLVERKFIEVRLARVAGNQEGALDLLSESLEQREKWRSSLRHHSSGVQVTIEEESGFARPILRRRMETLSTSGLPWTTLSERRRHRILYGELSLEWRKRLESKEKNQALLQCKQLGASKSSETPYYNEWIDQLCSPWKALAPASEPIEPASLKWTGTFGTLSLTSSSNSIRNELETIAQAAFKSSSWLQVASKDPLPIQAQGNFTETENRRTLNRKARYTVPKTIETRDPSGNIRKELQQEAREFNYSVELVSRTFQIDFNFACSPSSRPLSYQFKQSKYQEDETHQNRDQPSGVTPDPLNLQDSGSWLREQLGLIQDQWLQKLEEHWAETYCSGNSPFGLQSEENFARCFRSTFARNKVPPALNQFTTEKFGLSIDRLAEVLQLGSGS